VDSSTPAPRRPIPRLFIILALLFSFGAVMGWCGLTGKEDPVERQVHADFERILGALKAYRATHPAVPEEGGLDFLVPEYLPALPEDPWGRPYLYGSNGDRPLLQSLGEDGQRGGNGRNQDHTNHDGHSVLLK
jgi:general secretion pathway protein G